MKKRARTEAQEDLVEEYKGARTGKGMRKHFRRVSTQGHAKLDSAIDQIRRSHHHSRYQTALQALLVTAPKEVPYLFPVGRKRFEDLILSSAPFSAIPLENELRWTAVWLSARAPFLSEFRRVAGAISELVGQEKYDDALADLARFRDRVGWSLWTTELEIALTQLSGGSAGAKQLVAALRRSARPNSLAGLMAYLLGDRNDEQLSYDAFYTRCKENIPQMNVDSWVIDYLLYRALQHYDVTPAALAGNLRNERASCMIDLYETFIETCTAICSTFELRRYRSDVLAALDLLDDVDDHRLQKLRLYAGGEWRSGIEIEQVEASAWSDFHPFLLYRAPIQDAPVGHSERRLALLADMRDVWDRGSGADKAVARLLKFGVNLKSLDIGIAIASHAERQSSKTGPLMLIGSAVHFVLRGVSLEEIFGGPADITPNLLASYVERTGPDADTAALALRIASGAGGDVADLSELAKLWLANRCLLNGLYEQARIAADQLRTAGPRWNREATKHQFVSAFTRGDLKAACDVLARALVGDIALSVELPISEMFLGKKWADFSKINPIQVGIASHFAFDAPPTSPVGYILRASLRAILKSGKRAQLDGAPPLEANDAARDQFVMFFTEVWAEDSLSKSGSFDTTHDVRVERLNVVRRLLDWDPDNQAEYVDSIKALTLDETLWLGVKHINETRVFVNEPAITRWAEKELAEQHERWCDLVKSETNSEELTEEKLVEYLATPVDPRSGVEKSDRMTEADVQLINIVNRLLNRFLTDPTDGLNCYLSLRVRHGSLLRTLFGPAEAINLLIPESESEQDEVERAIQISGSHWGVDERAIEALTKFTSTMRALGVDLVDERVQLQSVFHPRGLLQAPVGLDLLLSKVDKLAHVRFSFFLEICYIIFWISLKRSLEDASAFFSQEVKQRLGDIYASLVEELSAIPSVSPAFIGQVKNAATISSAQCDLVASWFQLPNRREAQTFNVDQAVEIADSVAKNIFAGFEPVLERRGNCHDLPLSGFGLSTLFDCFYVIFDNVWQRSDTGRSPDIAVQIELEDDDVLYLRVESAVSAAVAAELRGGKLQTIRDRIDADSDELVPKEGSSGLPKLKRLTRSVPDTPTRRSFDFGLEGERTWFVALRMKLVRNESGACHVA